MTDYVVNIIIVDLIMFNKESHIYAKHRENFPINKDHLHIMIANWSMLQITRSFYLLALDRARVRVLQDKHSCPDFWSPIFANALKIPSHCEIRKSLSSIYELYFIIAQLITFTATLHRVVIINQIRNLSRNFYFYATK